MQTERLNDGHDEEEGHGERESLGNTLSATDAKEADPLVRPHELSVRGQETIGVKLLRVLKQRAEVILVPCMHTYNIYYRGPGIYDVKGLVPVLL